MKLLMMTVACILLASMAYATERLSPKQQEMVDALSNQIILRCMDTINDHGNTKVAAYCIERDTDGFQWSATNLGEFPSIYKKCQETLLADGGWDLVRRCMVKGIQEKGDIHATIK